MKNVNNHQPIALHCQRERDKLVQSNIKLPRAYEAPLANKPNITGHWCLLAYKKLLFWTLSPASFLQYRSI